MEGRGGLHIQLVTVTLRKRGDEGFTRSLSALSNPAHHPLPALCSSKLPKRPIRCIFNPMTAAAVFVETLDNFQYSKWLTLESVSCTLKLQPGKLKVKGLL